MPFLIPSLMSALAMGWLHVEAHRVADMINCYSLFLHRVNFSASFTQVIDLPTLVFLHIHSNWPSPGKFSEGSSVGIAPKGERAQL